MSRAAKVAHRGRAANEGTGRACEDAPAPPVAFAFAFALAASVASPAGAQELDLPGGFSATYQMEVSYGESNLGGGTSDPEPIFENWLDLAGTSGGFTMGLRFVAFAPPDPVIYPDGPDSYGFDFGFGEYLGEHFDARGGNFYALFGRGLALRSYESRQLRIDTNLLGFKGAVHLPDGELTGIFGPSVKGTAENADRGRTEEIGGLDVEYGLPLGFRAGGSWVTTDVPSQGTTTNEPQNMKAARLSNTVQDVDLYAEFARVDGPATSSGSAAPNVHGTGFYAVATTAIGRLGLLGEYKDYDRLVFDNAAGIAYILPPAGLREHQYNLLNRHPHQLDTRDEVGFQIEATYNTDAILDQGKTSFLFNWAYTRNHDPDVQQGNHFDDVYGEITQEYGDALLVGGLSYQRSFDSPEPADPFLTLWTPLADYRRPLGERYGLHLQFEHQHASSDRLGSFDTEFIVIEGSRSPDLTASLLIETTNKSETQLALQGEDETFFLGGEVSYTLFEQHELTFFVGSRNAGFICVGGVCRYEPAFDGAELKLISRF